VSKPKSLLRRCPQGALAIAMCFSLAIGCAKAPPESNDAKKSAPASMPQTETQSETDGLSTTTESTTPEAKLNPDRVVGIWLGTAAFNEANLKSKLNSLEEMRQDNVIAQAESFLSTVMAIEFRRDGSFENDLEMVAVDGQPLRDGTQGQWRMVESNGQAFVIETTETSTEGTTSTSQATYQLGQDVNEFSLSVPVTADLQGCDARLVFKRQLIPVADVAEGATGTQLK
jgi:hypothetical protein